MYFALVKTTLVEAVKRVFDADYPEADFRDVHVSMEYPDALAHYPGVWVDFQPGMDGLQAAGIGHVEWSGEGDDGSRRQFTRWRFGGSAQFTCVAMTSLERDRLVDEFIKIIAFGHEQPQRSDFRAYVEGGEFVALSLNWDRIGLTGKSDLPGTPWGTDDVIYEQTISLGCVGEFASEGTTLAFVPVSEVRVEDRRDDEPDPSPDDAEGTWV